jgi:hypothetical protein
LAIEKKISPKIFGIEAYILLLGKRKILEEINFEVKLETTDRSDFLKELANTLEIRINKNISSTLVGMN